MDKNLPEEWRPISGFQDYEISNYGRLRSYRRRTRKWRNPQNARRDDPIQVKGTVTNLGYVAHILREHPGSKPIRRMAHRLVALAFIENPQNYTDVCHNDGDPSNNHVSNLRWDTHQNNQADMRRHGTMQDGERCITSKLKEQDVLDIISHSQRHGRGSGVFLSKKYGVSRGLISEIINKKAWKYLHERA